MSCGVSSATAILLRLPVGAAKLCAGMVAAPAWHPLLKHKRISLDEVLRYPLVLVTHMHMGVMNVRSNECCRG
jgi:hypothetical protein